jgi:hypothetical protein
MNKPAFIWIKSVNAEHPINKAKPDECREARLPLFFSFFFWIFLGYGLHLHWVWVFFFNLLDAETQGAGSCFNWQLATGNYLFGTPATPALICLRLCWALDAVGSRWPLENPLATKLRVFVSICLQGGRGGREKKNDESDEHLLRR